VAPRSRNGRPENSPVPIFEIANATAFAVTTLRWPDVDSKPKLTIIVKATFVLGREGEDARPTPKQLPVFNNDIMTEAKPPSIRFESDLVPFKPCTDVVLVGRAYAPEGKPVTELVAGLRVGQLRYGVAVIGDRQWQAQLLDKPTISHKRLPSDGPVYDRLGFRQAGRDVLQREPCRHRLHRQAVGRIQGSGCPTSRILAPDQMEQRPRPAGFGFYGRGWRPGSRTLGHTTTST
jgi:hypothetical protein